MPVNPVWPYERGGIRSPLLAEKLELMSQPSPRTLRSPGAVDGDVIRATVSGERMRTPSSCPPLSSIRAKRARSAAVVKRPAWPATLFMRRAVGSCTTPRSHVPSPCPHGKEMGRHFSVGAMRGTSDAGGLNIVSFMPSGTNTFLRVNSSSGSPETSPTMWPSRKKLMSE